MFEEIEAVAFDIDGTLYPSWRLYLLMPLYVIKHLKFYLHYNKIRKILHRTAPLSDFFMNFQARLFLRRKQNFLLLNQKKS
ncbi:MAG: hypothetical protein L6V90_11460 [Treponema succinifaciens]|nr:MAG: hypothetical protein L6V90_11460 [Treponema succinifaciens]